MMQNVLVYENGQKVIRPAQFGELDFVGPIQEQIDALRKAAYQAEADPLFFKWQRGESTQQAWLDTIADIRNRYPDVIS